MKIAVNIKNEKNSDLNKILKFAVNYSVPYLFSSLPNTKKYYLNIYLKDKKTLKAENNVEVFGCAYHMFTNGKEIKHQNKSCIDLCENLKLNKMILTLFHELAHVKQMWINNIKFLDEGAVINEVLHPYSFCGSESLSSWEIEASGYETTLFNMFTECYKLKKINFSLPYDEFYGKLNNVPQPRRKNFKGIGEGSSGERYYFG